MLNADSTQSSPTEGWCPRSTRERGHRGEATAAAYFERSGWRVLASNYRFGRNEIDLIVMRAGIVAFVEVKARSRAKDGLESITRQKRAGIRRAAAGWLRQQGRSDLTYRFDAVSVRGASGRTLVEHLPDAWGI